MLNCYYFNAQSIVNKTSELHDVLYNVSPDCVFISESWLHADICNGLLDPKTEYTTIRKDRANARGGGVCAFVRRNFTVVPVVLTDKYSDLQLICLDFIDFKPVLRVFVVYRPPSHDHNAVLYAKLHNFNT